MQESTPDTPIVVLEQNRRFLKGAILMIICLTAIALCSVVSVIIAGDYSAGLPGETPVKQYIMFWCSLFSVFFLPYLLITGVRHLGNFTFYPDRLEFQSFWFDRRISIPYSKMYVNYENNGVSITTALLPTWKTPFARIKALFNSVSFPMIYDDRIGNFTVGISKRWLNPQDGPKAVKILEEKAFSVNYK